MHELRWHLEEASAAAAAAARRGLCEGGSALVSTAFLSTSFPSRLSSFIQTSMNILRLQCCRNAHCLSSLSIIISNSTIMCGCRCQIIIKIFRNAKYIIKFRINRFTSRQFSERYVFQKPSLLPNTNSNQGMHSHSSAEPMRYAKLHVSGRRSSSGSLSCARLHWFPAKTRGGEWKHGKMPAAGFIISLAGFCGLVYIGNQLQGF